MADDAPKRGVFGWMKSAMSKVEAALAEADATINSSESPAPPEPPAQAAPQGPSPRAASTGKLPQPGSAPLKTPTTRSDALALGARKASGPVATARTPEEEAEESGKRMALIIAYLQDPQGDPAFENKPFLYKIFTEERTYQQLRIAHLNSELRRMPPSPATMGTPPDDPAVREWEERRADLEAAIRSTQDRQAKIFSVIKRLTGVRGKTGGTGFIASPDGSGPLPDVPPPS